MSESDFELIMNRIVYGSTQKVESQKLQKLAGKITKVPKKFNIPIEYCIGDESI